MSNPDSVFALLGSTLGTCWRKREILVLNRFECDRHPECGYHLRACWHRWDCILYQQGVLSSHQRSESEGLIQRGNCWDPRCKNTHRKSPLLPHSQGLTSRCLRKKSLLPQPQGEWLQEEKGAQNEMFLNKREESWLSSAYRTRNMYFDKRDKEIDSAHKIRFLLQSHDKRGRDWL